MRYRNSENATSNGLQGYLPHRSAECLEKFLCVLRAEVLAGCTELERRLKARDEIKSGPRFVRSSIPTENSRQPRCNLGIPQLLRRAVPGVYWHHLVGVFAQSQRRLYRLTEKDDSHKLRAGSIYIAYRT